jgi:hypothetical protein
MDNRLGGTHLKAEPNYRVARQPRGCPALSEPGVNPNTLNGAETGSDRVDVLRPVSLGKEHADGIGALGLPSGIQDLTEILIVEIQVCFAFGVGIDSDDGQLQVHREDVPGQRNTVGDFPLNDFLRL